MLDASSILNHFPGIVYAFYADSEEIIYINEKARRLLGECVGKTRVEALSDILTPKNNQRRYEIYEDNVSAKLYSSNNGMTFAVYSSVSELNGREIVVETALDITSAEEERRDYEKRLGREHAIVSCMIELQKNKPFDETINYILSLAGRYLDAPRVYTYKFDGGNAIRTHVWQDGNVQDTATDAVSIDIRVIERWITIFDNHSCVLLNDIEEIKDSSPEGYEILSGLGADRIVAAPLYVDDRLVGFIGVDNLPADKMKDGELFFTALSTFITTVIVRKRAEDALRQMSYIDTLTNIYNRNKFIHDCEEMAQRNEKNVGIIYTDLNGLKEINDKKGHSEGDNALKEIALIISEIFADYNCYRVGGDEFVVICRSIDEDTFSRLTEALSERLKKCNRKIAVGYKYAGEDDNIDDVVKAADENMYRDKKAFYRNTGQSGRYRVRNDNYIAISTPERIKKLMKDERFVIWFQPRFSADTREFCGSEALIRFFGEDDMIISPMDFIPEMEDNDTIHLLDLYVFRHVCAYLADWINKGKNVRPVSLNMSHSTLRKPNIIENLMEIWYGYNVPKELIVIEVSEDQDKGGISDIFDVLGDLKKCGFRLAIDNFGSKYADLYLFADLKFDVLKLDGDMVYKIETDKKTQILSTSIMQICHNENIKIVAAGVENEKELTALREIGCDEVQGYLFDKPMSWDKFELKYL